MSHDIHQDARASFLIATRRDLLKRSGLLTVTGIAAGTGLLRLGSSAAAQDATPAAEDGLTGAYMVIRSRQLAEGYTAEEVMASIESGFVPLLGMVAGFVAYLAIADPASSATAFITICTDKGGTETSTQLAGKWLSDNGFAYFDGDPILIEGPIALAAGEIPSVSTSAATPVAVASPAAAEGGAPFVAIRSRKVKADRSIPEMLTLIETGFVPLVTETPGVLTYLVSANEDTRDQFAVTIATDQTVIEQTTSKAAEWGQQGAADFVEGDPTVIQGSLWIAVSAIS